MTGGVTDSATEPERAARAGRHLYLVDGSGFIFRAYHALPPMTRPDGTPVNAVYGFCSMLMRLLEDAAKDAAPDRIAVIFDASRHNYRNDIYPEYKANRDAPPEDLVPQFPLIREAVDAFNLPCIEQEGYEADDLIATYAREAAAAGDRVTIVSSDKDLMQLVAERIEMFDPIKLAPIRAEQVLEKFGVAPDRVVDVQALAGDPTDNVPGVPGIGVKTAAQLIGEYGDLETLLERAPEIKQPKRRQNLIEFAEQARISKRLVRLEDHVPVERMLDSFGPVVPDPGRLVGFFEDQGFRSLVARAQGSLARTTETIAAQAIAAPVVPDRVEYELIVDHAALLAWVAAAQERGRVAFDTETTSLDPHRAELVGISLSVDPGRACYIPVGHCRPGGDGGLDLDGAGPLQQADCTAVLDMLRPLFADTSVMKIAQNAKFDMEVLARYGIETIEPVDDTMLLSYVLDGALHGHGMDELARLHLGHETIKYADVTGKGRAQISFAEVALDRARDYAAEDADITLRLWQVLRPRLALERMVGVHETMERPLVPVLAAMECAGIRVDRSVLQDLSTDFATRLAELETEIHRLAGRPFNVGSPKQLGEILYDEMGLTGGKRAKTGAWVTDADVLDDFAAQGHDLPARVLDWRQLSKLKSTYADALLNSIHPETGRVHTCFSQTVASTGRLSSSDPNLQNIPVRTEEGRKIRAAFVAEEGHLLLSADYSQIELRLLAHVAEIPALTEAFRDGLDIHAMTASQVFGQPIEGMDPLLRRQAKAINFGIIYGISPFGLARQLGIGQAEARQYIQGYFARFPGIADYMERAKEFAREHGYVTTIFGRRCHVPGIKDKNQARRAFQERVAINAPLQGSAADIIKRAMIALPSALSEAGLSGRLLLQVHDELLLEVPETEVEATTEVVRRTMEAGASLRVPLVVETGAARSWAAAH